MSTPLLLRLLLPGLLALGLFTGCSSSSLEELTREELFSLSLGRMENQIDLFQSPGELFNQRTSVFMREGLFYITNGRSAKLMGFSSYGDLILLLYNSEHNPRPFMEPAEDAGASSAGSMTTRIAVPYPLRDVGEIVVNGDRQIYLSDAVPAGREVRDAETGVILNRTLLQFDRRGRFLHFIGQEGIGGSPFPYIDSLHINAKDELVVVCRTPRAWLVFWYSREGLLLHHLSLDADRLPRFREELIPFVVKLYPDPHDPALHLLLYYYQEVVDTSTGVREKVSSDTARIYRLELDSGRFSSYVNVPQETRRREQIGVRQQEVQGPSYELLGVSETGYFYLIRPEDTNLFQLLLLDRAGQVAARRLVVIEDSDLYFRTLALSSTGIIYALLCEEDRVKVAWWRSDRLLKEGKP